MATCPAGHSSDQDDFCAVCGLPIEASEQPSPEAPEAAPPSAALICPSCGAQNVTDALFCEACGFDFTGAAAPTETDTPQWPTLGESSQTPQPAAAAATPPAAQPATAKPAVEWIAELWIDPEWYAAQGSTDPMPSVGLPDIVPLIKESNLIGRLSHSRGIFPDVECELDSGCSRRHAMLTHDGSRWWIEDLGSANGTFVGPAAGPLPAMPIPQGRVELTAGQRIYVGAWTRIVIRKATPEEQEAFSS